MAQNITEAGTLQRVPVSILAMNTFNGWLAVSLFFAQVVAAQQITSHPARIICTPPTMKVLKMVRPTFPPDAKARTIFGKVAVEVEIDKTGKPSSMKVIKGDPILAAAVVEAVKKWRWRPLKLNGVTVEAETTIIVNVEPR